MPVHYASGLEDPAVRQQMMSGAQQGSVNTPVTSMGLGITSAFQGARSGNNSLATVRKLLKAVLDEKARVKERKDKKKKKRTKAKKLKGEDQQRSVGRTDRIATPVTPVSPPIQLPEPTQGKGIA